MAQKKRRQQKERDTKLERTLYNADASAVEMTLRLRITSVHALIVEIKDGKVKATHELDTRYIDAEGKKQ